LPIKTLEKLMIFYLGNLFYT